MSGEFPVIKSAHSLVAKHVTKERWDKVKDIETKTCGFTIAKACACAIEFDNQHCGIYAGDWDSYKVNRNPLNLLPWRLPSCVGLC